MANMKFNIRVLLYRENETWVAQCLEYDIAAQGRSLDEVQSRLQRTFIGQVVLDLDMGKAPLKNIAKAPAVFWERFESSTHRLKDPKPFSSADIPPAYMVSAIAEEAICA